MVNNDIKALRNLVRKRRAAVTAKETRIEKNTGINIKGTKEDPRLPPSVVDRYTRTQLNSYLGRLNAFMSRSNGYIADASGSLIKRSEWESYTGVERRYNAIAKKDFDKIKNLLDPISGVKISDREKIMNPDSKRAQGDVIHRPFSEVHRKPQNIKNEKSLVILRKSLEKKLAKNYLPKQIASQRRQARDMAKNAGIKIDFASLSDLQFNALWNYTGFATRLGQIGSSGSHRSKNVREGDSKDRMNAQDKDGIAEDVQSIVDKAKNWSID